MFIIASVIIVIIVIEVLLWFGLIQQYFIWSAASVDNGYVLTKEDVDSYDKCSCL